LGSERMEHPPTRCPPFRIRKGTFVHCGAQRHENLPEDSYQGGMSFIRRQLKPIVAVNEGL
jgi:hypothetical protein